MGQLHSPARYRDTARVPLHGGENGHKDSDLDDLRAENAQLRALVIQLSKLVIRNIVERK